MKASTAEWLATRLLCRADKIRTLRQFNFVPTARRSARNTKCRRAKVFVGGGNVSRVAVCYDWLVVGKSRSAIFPTPVAKYLMMPTGYRQDELDDLPELEAFIQR
jgi:hypothetical protein